MRLTLTIESRRHPQREVEALRSDHGNPQPEREVEPRSPVASRQPEAFKVIEDSWRKAVDAPPATQPGLMQWVGGAIVAYATLLDLDPEAVRADLLRRIPPASRQQERFFGDDEVGFVVQPRDPRRPPRPQRTIPPEELDSIVDGEATS